MKTFHGFRIQIKTITKSKMNSIPDPSINMGKISGVILHSSLFQVKFQSSKFEIKNILGSIASNNMSRKALICSTMNVQSVHFINVRLFIKCPLFRSSRLLQSLSYQRNCDPGHHKFISKYIFRTR